MTCNHNNATSSSSSSSLLLLRRNYASINSRINLGQDEQHQASHLPRSILLSSPPTSQFQNERDHLSSSILTSAIISTNNTTAKLIPKQRENTSMESLSSIIDDVLDILGDMDDL